MVDKDAIFLFENNMLHEYILYLGNIITLLSLIKFSKMVIWKYNKLT